MKKDLEDSRRQTIMTKWNKEGNVMMIELPSLAAAVAALVSLLEFGLCPFTKQNKTT